MNKFKFYEAWNACARTRESMDEDEQLSTIIMGTAIIGVAFFIGYRFGRTVNAKEIEAFLDSCIKWTKNGTGVLLEVSTKKNKGIPVYIWKE